MLIKSPCARQAQTTVVPATRHKLMITAENRSGKTIFLLLDLLLVYLSPTEKSSTSTVTFATNFHHSTVLSSSLARLKTGEYIVIYFGIYYVNHLNQMGVSIAARHV